MYLFLREKIEHSLSFGTILFGGFLKTIKNKALFEHLTL